jgi:hypothetical protein
MTGSCLLLSAGGGIIETKVRRGAGKERQRNRLNLFGNAWSKSTVNKILKTTNIKK